MDRDSKAGNKEGRAQTFGGERGLGEVEETKSLAEATHLLN